MLSNAYFLGKFRFDTAENEPAKNLQNFRKHMHKMHKNVFVHRGPAGRADGRHADDASAAQREAPVRARRAASAAISVR